MISPWSSHFLTSLTNHLGFSKHQKKKQSPCKSDVSSPLSPLRLPIWIVYPHSPKVIGKKKSHVLRSGLQKKSIKSSRGFPGGSPIAEDLHTSRNRFAAADGLRVIHFGAHPANRDTGSFHGAHGHALGAFPVLDPGNIRMARYGEPDVEMMGIWGSPSNNSSMDSFSWENLHRKPMGFDHQIDRAFRSKFSHHPILWIVG